MSSHPLASNMGETRAEAFLARRMRLGFAPPPAKVVDLLAIGRRVKKSAPVVEVALPIGAPFNFYARPGWDNIVRLVALRRGVAVDDILSRRKPVVVSLARQYAMALVYSHCRLSLTVVGRLFKRDHTSVLYAVRSNSLGHSAKLGRNQSVQ